MIFNEYFTEQCRLPAGAANHDLPPFTLLSESHLHLPHLDEEHILDILKQLPSGKATGPAAVSIYKPQTF